DVVAVDQHTNQRHLHAEVVRELVEGLEHDELFSGLLRRCELLLRLGDGSLRQIPRRRCVRVFARDENERRVLLVHETFAYRRLAKTQVGQADAVLEIGSSFGECTHILASHAREVLGIDNSPELVEESRRRYPTLHFELLDALSEPEQLAELCRSLCAGSGGGFKVFVDIGGDRLGGAVCRALVQLWHICEEIGVLPSLVVVKCKSLAANAANACDARGDICELPAWWQACSAVTSVRQRKKLAGGLWTGKSSGVPALTGSLETLQP
ncbi:unnamed protein product, partial [Effrenium voratum]